MTALEHHEVENRTNDTLLVLKDMLRTEGIDLRDDAEWNELLEHVRVHKYLINENIGGTVSWDEAIFSWHENVYRPVLEAANNWIVRHAFPHKTNGQLYLAITTHWHYLKEKRSDIFPDVAAMNFASRYGSGLARFLSALA